MEFKHANMIMIISLNISEYNSCGSQTYHTSHARYQVLLEKDKPYLPGFQTRDNFGSIANAVLN